MELFEWLDAEDGRSAALAAHMGLTRGAVSQWRDVGVPVDHMESVSAFTDGVVTLPAMLAHRIECGKQRKATA